MLRGAPVGCEAEQVSFRPDTAPGSSSRTTLGEPFPAGWASPVCAVPHPPARTGARGSGRGSGVGAGVGGTGAGEGKGGWSTVCPGTVSAVAGGRSPVASTGCWAVGGSAGRNSSQPHSGAAVAGDDPTSLVLEVTGAARSTAVPATSSTGTGSAAVSRTGAVTGAAADSAAGGWSVAGSSVVGWSVAGSS